MRPVPILVALVSLGIALSAVSWVSKSSLPIDDNDAKANSDAPRAEPPSENPLEISKTGPYPKAVLENGMHEFGAMELGQKLSHSYVVRNDGDAPLLLKKGVVQCKCTVPITPEEPIPPGESVEIELTWEPKAAAEEFHQKAQIWTNDPNNPELELHVKGAVEKMFQVLPGYEWQVNGSGKDEPIRFNGLVLSALVDDLEIVDYKASTDQLQAEFVPLNDEELEEFDVKSGFRVTGTIDGDPPIGKFRETLTMISNTVGDVEVVVHLSGFFPGPFSILGNDWIGSEMLLKMGHVKASEGKSVTLSMFIPREDEPMQFEVLEADPAFLDLTIARDESFDAPAREKYALTFIVPPGTSIGSWQEENVGTLKVKTNREIAPEFDLHVNVIVEN